MDRAGSAPQDGVTRAHGEGMAQDSDVSVSPMKNRLPLWALMLSMLLTSMAVAKPISPLTREQAADVVQAIDGALRAHLFDPDLTETSDYLVLQQRLQAFVQAGYDRAAFAEAFNAVWAQGPFSHVQLLASPQRADDMAAYLDGMRVGPEATTLSWQGDVAVLTVNTMMGQDTIETLSATFAQLSEKASPNLIIDLRQNKGGAFAVVPLVGHLIEQAVDAGFFVSQTWHRAHAQLPSADLVQARTPWQGWSIRSFWSDVQQGDGLLRIRFVPMQPRYRGAVYVLTSRNTASAAEMAVDALRAAGRITQVGERTAGQMLSQKMFDLPHGFLLSVPIADYIGLHSGRIEGRGIDPDVSIDASQALEAALALAKSGSQESN
jgi:carboxyl-terminal processing protease